MFTPRLGALVAGTAVVASAITLVATPAQAAGGGDPRPATVGANWLAGQLTNGLMHNPTFGGFDDYGLSIDAGFALDSVGGHGTDVTAISSALASHITSYVTGEDFGDTGSSYAGQTAKAAVFATVAGADPTSYGGQNLITRLEARVATAAPITGRIEDLSSFGTDYANVIGQAFAVNALETASSTKAPDALAFLLEQQCSAGYFRLNFAAKDATDQTCEATRGTAASAPDPDVTSTAIRMLLPLVDSSAGAARALGRAEAWLLAQQRADGSFVGGTSTATPNANSTGLAGWALGLLGDTDAATRTAVWVRQHQADEVTACTNSLASQTGAIGYDDPGVTQGIKNGITDVTSDQWRRATSQGLPVLQWAPAAAAADVLSGPTGYVRAQTTATFRVAGAVPGEKVCLSGYGSHVRGEIGADGKANLRVVLPSGTATRTYVVSDRLSHTASAIVKVLGTVRLSVTPARTRVRASHFVRVVVRGLAAGERTSLRLRGVLVRTGTATSTGTWTVTINVRARLGRATIAAFGQFPSIRHGSATITVIR